MSSHRLEWTRRRTLHEMSQSMRVSTERVRQIEIRAVKKLRSAEASHSLKDYLLEI